MECNKDEAIRAKEISERKMIEKDMAGAQKFALKAQNLYPGLDGLPQLLATIDVYVAFERKVYGEADWYRILGVDPMADDDTIRKHYRKLALVLHPDKNKFAGADGAFKIISEAWSLLSDRAKRTAYDLKRNSRVVPQKAPTTSWSAQPTGSSFGHNFTKSNNTARNQSARPTGNNATRKPSVPPTGNNATRKPSAPPTGNNAARNQSAPPTGNRAARNQSAPPTGNSAARNQSAQTSNSGSHNFTSSDNTSRSQSAPTRNNGVHNTVDQKHATNPKPGRPPLHSSKPNTFWTQCTLCGMLYEHLRTYLNCALRCLNCKEPFTAVEKPPPSAFTSGSFIPWTAYQHQQSSTRQIGLHTTKDNSFSSGRTPASSPNAEPVCSSSVNPVNHANSASGLHSNSFIPWTAYHHQQSSTQQIGLYTTKENSFSSGRSPASTPYAEPACSSSVNPVNHANSASGLHSKSDVGIPAAASPIDQPTHMVQPAHEKFERGHLDAMTEAMKEASLLRKTTISKNCGGLATAGETPLKRRRINEHNPSDSARPVMNQMKMGNEGAGMESVAGFPSNSEMRRSNASGSSRPAGRREPSQLEIRSMLMEKARREIIKKVTEWRFAAASRASQKEEEEEEEKEKKKEKEKEEEKEKEKENEKEKEKPKAAGNGRNINATKPSESSDSNNRVQPKTSANSPIDTEENETEPMTMSVPDPDIHDFDKDRTEQSFGENQVWAAYDDDDGMPRYYAMIHSVISLDPFKMRISWLNAKSNAELAPLNWVGSGFPKTSGEFRIGKHEDNNSLNSFSHKVKWTKGMRGVVQIYPRRGDVWALYRNWSPKWNEHTPDEVIHKYDMVEVNKDYNEDGGVTVVPLVKVSGFKTVFRHHLDPHKVRIIPKKELFRFSHQVPSYLLTGEEAENVPKGCLELDPAATPLELLQAETDEEDKKAGTAGKGKEQMEET